MQHLRISSPRELTSKVLTVLQDDPAVTSLSCVRGASLEPDGDVIEADVAREAMNDVVDRPAPPRRAPAGNRPHPAGGHLVVAERARGRAPDPGSSADSVVWADVTQRAYEESELNWTYLTFMTLATLIASIAIVLDYRSSSSARWCSGPSSCAIAALGLALVRRRYSLLWYASRTLVLGFGVAIALTTLARSPAVGWAGSPSGRSPHPGPTPPSSTPRTSGPSSSPSSPRPPASCPSPRPRSEACPVSSSR